MSKGTQKKSISRQSSARITKRELQATRDAIRAALHYEALLGRKLGITAEVGEILACHALQLKLMRDPLTEGYDAVDARGKRYQIKTRRSASGGLPLDKGKMGRFSQHAFDYAVLCILDAEYEVFELWRAPYRKVEPLIAADKYRSPRLRAFKSVAAKLAVRTVVNLG